MWVADGVQKGESTAQRWSAVWLVLKFFGFAVDFPVKRWAGLSK
jgi:hypothetical protein